MTIQKILQKEVNGITLENRIIPFKQDISDLDKFITGNRTGLYNPRNDILDIYLRFDYDCAVMEQDKQFSRMCVDYNINGNLLGEIIQGYELK